MSKWELKKLKGNEEFRQKNYGAAIGYYTEAIELDSTQDILYSNRGLSYMNIGNNEKAKLDLNKAIEINPKNIKALRRLSAVLLTEGELLESEIYLNRAYNVDPKAEMIEENLNEIKELIKKKDNYQTFKIIKEYQKCYEILTLLITKLTQCYEIKKEYLEMCINTFNIDSGLNFYKNSLTEKEKKYDYVQYLLSLLFFTDGKYEQSRLILTNLLSITNDEKILEDSKNLNNKLEQILQLKMDANESFKNNNFDNALEIYNKLLKLDNNNKLFNAYILSNISLCFYKKGEQFNALHNINESIQLNDKYWKSFFRRAKINISLKYGEKAKNDLKKVLELDPSNREALLLLDEINREENKTKRKDLYKILEIDKFANQDDIRFAYKKLVHKWHPDKNNQNKEQKEYAEKMFKDINEAYTILSNTNKKMIYDNGGFPTDEDDIKEDHVNNFIFEKYKNKGSPKNNSYKNDNFIFSSSSNKNHKKKKRERSRDYYKDK